MDSERELRFYKLYEQLASLTQIVEEKPDIPRIEQILNEIAAMFRLSKGVTHFYRDPGAEERNEGETMISYDTGEVGKPVHTVRCVNRLMLITTMTVYMTENAQPLTEEEMAKLDLAMRTAVIYICRNRLQVIAEKLAFFDDVGYRNIRSFFRYITWKGQPGDFNGKVAINYNLRHFAVVNEKYGRAGGDTVLLNHYKHIENIIGEGGIVARLGGDAFVCICDQTDLPDILEYLNEAIVVVDNEGRTVRVSCCAGVFCIPDGYAVRVPNDIMGKIMHAYQVARNTAQGNIIFFSDMLMSDKERSRRIQSIFPEALLDNEFKVFYQPKININTGEICGAEALCRWFHDGNIVPPMEFIPVLEETNEICKLDYYMLDKVCGNIRQWLDEGRKAVRVSVNLSRRHMTNPELLKELIEIIDRHNVPHEYIEIELTETTTDVEFKDLKRVVEGLQQQDICTSVDDFGMGYSSLNLIRVVPWNVIKVDKIFLPLDGESPDSTRSVMFKYVVAMANELGLECIVEGVETASQLELLRQNGCYLAQGYLFDKPLPQSEFEKRLDMGKYKV
ncbi:bifunctional diguanylate cyclase/phosphodiesterase [Ruminococcus flavefaciens]|uniref:EAL domain, c-di-GMP-specific phosphodiesterase class I (Or its enzymatically inactive variant) n=1 Tax=Ruminococcus flavefaciens TaxID=1265 RepID=A0A1M7L1Q2_RUMFL|nr:GGDEF domain-containing phosphodiesterase [Ruminococcus flavefaciens]SHM71778.1 EAL domain, c-di-GMP-specific phosphodiesterase class I (or its enzymatically inactive variant) [Ruminococcus flavefaciens]